MSGYLGLVREPSHLNKLAHGVRAHTNLRQVWLGPLAQGVDHCAKAVKHDMGILAHLQNGQVVFSISEIVILKPSYCSTHNYN
jgi:hypothetical protein